MFLAILLDKDFNFLFSFQRCYYVWSCCWKTTIQVGAKEERGEGWFRNIPLEVAVYLKKLYYTICDICAS